MAGVFSCLLLVVSILGCIYQTETADTIDLNGNWTILNGLRGYKVEGRVPGSMYTALYENKLIPDPLYRDNDVKLRWVGREDWTFSRSFTLSASDLASSSVLLVCDGLDTFSTVFINDQQVGVSDNMFVQYVYDIKAAAKAGENSIRVAFKSAVTVAAQKANASAYDIPNDCPSPYQHGECHVNQIRKEQCSFSWDWGPSFPTQGIWKNIYIQAFNSAVIREMSASPYRGTLGEWVVDIRVYFDVSGQVTGTLATDLIGTTISKSQPVTLSANKTSMTYSLTIPSNVNIEKWWPNGYGNQTLYILNVTFTSGSDTSNKQRRVGFRTVELVQDKVNKDQGLTFYFKINGIPIFFKGTNWIPADSFQETITKERLRRLLVSAADVHINSMRVWGGGIYESEDLYDLADELGIMIWQDLMFSVALYPTTQDFLNSVSREVTHQIRRMRHHPSIVIWAGNNENEAGLRGGWFGIKKNFTRYYDDYVTLYVKTIMPIVQKEDMTRKYLTSSPSDGLETEKEGWVAKDPGSQLYGDVHFYDYIRDLWSDSTFPIPRFASEYGVQAWCDPESLENVFMSSDFDYWGNMAYHRNHHPLGNVEMIEAIVLHFREPMNRDPKQKFKDLIYLTQINQAMSIRTESEHYRRWSNHMTSDGRGQTMGALYWQLNDIWQAPTWASIDYNGKWKMLHYYTEKFFAPILVSPFFNESSLMIFMVVDEIPLFEREDKDTGVQQFAPASSYRDLFGSEFPRSEYVRLMTKSADATTGTLTVQMYQWDNFLPLKTWNVTYKLSRSSELVFQQDVSSMMSESGCPDRSSCFVYMYVDNPDSGIDSSLPLTYYKDVKGLEKAQILFTEVTQLSNTEYLVKLETNRIAPFVWVDAHGISGRFSDNGFLMLTPTQEVTFTSWEPVDLDLFKKSLSVKSLMDVQHVEN